MRFRILRAGELPLGTRTLRLGDKGADVKKLQELLAQNGFYFGGIDGSYGSLTEEAVRLLERAFQLTVDGIAGQQVITALKDPSRQNSRIIYTVKARENLKSISRKWGVNPIAWQGIPGRGNPKKRLYVGMRLLLHQKALFLLDDPTVRSGSSKSGLPKSGTQLQNNINITGSISPGWSIDPSGDLVCLDNDLSFQQDRYRTIEAQPEVWKALMSSKLLRSKLAMRLWKLKSTFFGLDLRTVPLDTIINWPKLLKSLWNNINRRYFRFLILPLLPPPKHGGSKYAHEIPVYWFSLSQIAQYAGLLIFDPLLDTENPSSYENSAGMLPQTLKEINNRQLNQKSLLLITPECWDWNLDSQTSQTIPYSKARMIRTVNLRAAEYSSRSKLTIIPYINRHEAHCLIYRDIQGLAELFALINKTNLLGLVIHNFEVLGKAGIEVILNSFTILPGPKLQPGSGCK